MNPKSGSALLWLSAILIVVAFMIASPAGTFAALVVAAICAAISLASGAKPRRIFSLVLLLAAIVLAIRTYPAFQHDQAAYRERAAKP